MSGPDRAPTVRDIGIIVGLSAVVLVPSLFTREPWDPDESRYVEVAREMVVRGDYLVPHLNGEPYADKPPLFFWLTAGLWRLGLGVNSGRIVASLATVCALVAAPAAGAGLRNPAGLA